VPKIGKYDTSDINLPTIFMGMEGLDGGSTSSTWSAYATGFFAQFYIRNYHPRIYKEYLWILSGAINTGCSLAMFILSFAVYGAVGNMHAFPRWWGNHTEAGDYVDHCPKHK
jgi:hypothetical protein